MAYGLPRGGERIVVTRRGDGVSGRELVLPGAAGWPGVVPPGSGVFRDEFDAPLGGSWVRNVESGAVVDANTSHPSHLYVRTPKSGTAQLSLVYRPIPAYPFTFETWVTDATTRCGTGGNMEAGIGVMEAAPGKVQALFHRDNGSSDMNWGIQSWTTPTTFGSNGTQLASSTGFGCRAPYGMRLVATSTSSLAWYVSTDGLGWLLVASGVNPGFTIGNVGFVVYGGAQNTYTHEVIYDYARIS